MSQKQLFILSFFGLLILIFLQLLGIFQLFLIPMVWAVLLAFIFYPLFRRLLRMVRGRKNAAAALTVLIVIILTLGPVIFFSGTLFHELLGFSQNLGEWIVQKKYMALWQRVLDSPLQSVWARFMEKTTSWNIQVMPIIQKTVQSITQTVLAQIQNGAKNFLIFILYYFLTIFIFFFFVRDGKSLGLALKHLFPMTSENKEMVFNRLGNTVSAVVRGLVVTALAQSLLAGAAFAILGVPFPVLLSLLVAFLALVPLGGAVIVWFPSAVYLFLIGSWGKALILFIWGAAVVSTVDNIIKPILIGERTKLPTLFLFLAILGGIAFYGFVGVFLGPIMLALFLTLIEIYRKEYPETN